MKYHDLNLGRQKKSRRVGRGIAAGQGKTAGRGTKGQNSRTGGRRRPGFEGGQTPLMQRLPKLAGFRSIRLKPEVVYTGQLNSLTEQAVDNFSLAKSELISSPYVKVKIITKGELTTKHDVKLQSVSQSAKHMIEAAGGSFVRTGQVARVAKKSVTAQNDQPVPTTNHGLDSKQK